MDGCSLSPEERSDLTFQLITEFSFTALQSLIDVAGSYRAVELNRPYWHHAGKAAGLVAMHNFPSQVTMDLRGWAFMTRFIEVVLRRGRRMSSTKTSLAQQGVFDHCPFENGPPEFCYLLDYVVANGVLESLGLDYELLLEASMAEGAPVCVFTMIGRSHALGQADLAEFDVPTLPDIPVEVLDSFTLQYLGEHWVMITRAIDDCEDREQVLDLLCTRLRELGRTRADELMKTLGLSGRNLAAIVAVLDFLNSLLFQEGETVLTAEGEEKRMRRCPFQFAPEDICVQFEAFTNGIIEAINPRYELVHPEAMCRGNDLCIRSIRERTEVSSGR